MRKTTVIFPLLALCIFQFLFAANLEAQNCWSSLGTNLGSGVAHRPNNVYSLTTYNGELVVGGSFDTLTGNYGSVLAWNGASWANLGLGLKGHPYVSVFAMVSYNGDLYVAGNFDTAGTIPAGNIAKWDGTTWSALGSGTSNSITSLVVYNGMLYAGGYFALAGGTPVSNLAKWDGNVWTDVGGGTRHGYINCLTVINNEMYIGGRFDSVGNIPARNVAVWNGTAWSALDGGVGIPDQASNMAGGSIIDAIVDYQGEVYTAGLNLDSIRGSNINNIAKWDGNSWSGVAGGVWNDIYSLCVYEGKLIAGGSFIRANGVDTIWNLAQWNGTSWSAFGGGIPRQGPEINAMDTFNGGLFVGGSFNIVDGITVNGIAQYNCSTGINEISASANVFVFPNPTNGTLNISVENLQGKASIQIYNLLGQKVLQANLNIDKTEVNLTGAAPGTYLYHISAGNGEYIGSGAFVVQ